MLSYSEFTARSHKWIRKPMKKFDFSSYKSALILTGMLSVALFASQAHAQSDSADRADKAGRLSTINRHPVLHLMGDDPKERGFAHGYLLAEIILGDFDAALVSLPNFSAKAFQNKLLPWAKDELVWDANFLAEIAGLIE